MAWWTRKTDPDPSEAWAQHAAGAGADFELSNVGYRTDIAPDPLNDPAQTLADLIPSDVTIGQILDYTAGGDTWPLDFYTLATPTRDTAITYATFHRCVHLIACIIAILVTGGGLSVVDQQGNRVYPRKKGSTAPVNRRAKWAVDALIHDPDGELPALQWVEDTALDYLIDGNYLVWSRRRASADGLQLDRCIPTQAQIHRGRDTGTPMYELHPIRDPGHTEFVSDRNVCHGRWGLTGRAGLSRNGRERWARPPLIALRPALKIGLQADQWIASYFATGLKGGAKAKVAVGFDGPLNDDEQRQIAEYIKSSVRSNLPLALGKNASYTQLKEGPQDADAEKLREFQVRECSRVFGVPPPLAGENVTQWGEGIATLARLFWQYGGEHHISRFMAPFESRLLEPGHRFRYDLMRLLMGDWEAMAKVVMAAGGDMQRRRIGHIEEMRHMFGLTVDDPPPDDRLDLLKAGADLRRSSGSQDDNRNQ